MYGKPAIRGTLLMVEHIVRHLAAGATPEKVIKGYPRLTIDDIHAAQAFAADYLATDDIALLDDALLADECCAVSLVQALRQEDGGEAL